MTICENCQYLGGVEKMKCPQCGNELKQTNKFCPECGKKVEQKNISECPMCHQPISKGVIICPNCKNNIHTYNTTPPSSADKDLNKKNIRFTITFIICCIAAVFGIVFAAEYCTNDSIENSKTTTNHITEKATKRVYNQEGTTYNSKRWSTEKTTEKTTEKPTEKPTDVIDTMTKIFTNDDIVIYYSDCELYNYSKDEVDFHLFVENKTGKSITVQADTVILDGISYNKLVCSDPISANSKGMIEISVRDCTNVSPSTVGADLRYFYTNEHDDTFKINIASQNVK